MKYQDLERISRAIELLLLQGANKLNIIDPSSASQVAPEIAAHQFDEFKEIIRDNRLLLHSKQGIALISKLPESWRLFYAQQLLRANDGSHAYHAFTLDELKQILAMLENDYRLDFIIDFKQRVPLMADDLKFTKTDDNELIQAIFNDDSIPTFRSQRQDDEVFYAMQIELTETLSRTPNLSQTRVYDIIEEKLRIRLSKISVAQVDDLNIPSPFNQLTHCEFLLRLARYPNGTSIDQRYLSATPWRPGALSWLAERAGYLLCVELSYLPQKQQLKFALEHLHTLFWIDPIYLNQALKILANDDREKLFYNYCETNEELSSITDEVHFIKLVQCVHHLDDVKLRRAAMLLLQDKLGDLNWIRINKGELYFHCPATTVPGQASAQPILTREIDLSDMIIVQFCMDNPYRVPTAKIHLNHLIQTKKARIEAMSAAIPGSAERVDPLSPQEIQNFLNYFASFVNIEPYDIDEAKAQFKWLCTEMQFPIIGTGYPKAAAYFKAAREKQSSFLSQINAYGFMIDLLCTAGLENELYNGPLSWMIDQWIAVLASHEQYFPKGTFTFNMEHLKRINPKGLSLLLNSLPVIQRIQLLDEFYKELHQWPIDPVEQFEFLMPILNLPVPKNPEDPIYKLVHQFMARYHEVEDKPIDWGRTDTKGELLARTSNTNHLAWAIYLIPANQRMRFAENLLRPIFNKENQSAEILNQSMLRFISHALEGTATKEQLDAYSKKFLRFRAAYSAEQEKAAINMATI